MTKDYAKIKTKSQRKPLPKAKAHPITKGGEGRLWLLVLVLMGLFITGLVYLKHEGKKMVNAQKELGVPQNLLAVDSKSKPKAQDNTEKQQPRFDFYTMLPEGQSEAAETEAKKPEKIDTKPVQNPEVTTTLSKTAREEIANFTKQQLEAVAKGTS